MARRSEVQQPSQPTADVHTAPPDAAGYASRSEQDLIIRNKPCSVPHIEERLSGNTWAYPDGDWLFDSAKEGSLNGDGLKLSPSASWINSFTSAGWDLSKPRPSSQEVLKGIQPVIDPPLAGDELVMLRRYATYMDGLFMSRLACEAKHHKFHILARHARDNPGEDAADDVQPSQGTESRARKLADDALKSRWAKMGYWEGTQANAICVYEEENPICCHSPLKMVDTDVAMVDCLRCSMTRDCPFMEDAAKRSRGEPPKIHNPATTGHGLSGQKHRLFVQSRPWYLFEMNVMEERIRFRRLERPVRIYFNESDSHDIRNPVVRVAELWKSWGGVYEAAITKAPQGLEGIPLIGWQWRQGSDVDEAEMDIPELPPAGPCDNSLFRDDDLTPSERVRNRRRAKPVSTRGSSSPNRIIKRESGAHLNASPRRSARQAAARASSRVSEMLEPKRQSHQKSASR